MTVTPENLKYTTDHEWVDDQAEPVRVGITAVATEELGDIVYVELPEAGSEITAGEACGEVESTKSVADLYAPVTGTVVEVNGIAVNDPALINKDPYGAGWLYTVKTDDTSGLLSAGDYAKHNEDS